SSVLNNSIDEYMGRPPSCLRFLSATRNVTNGPCFGVGGSAVMRPLAGACLLVLVLTSSGSAASLEDARLRWLKGNYEEAQEQYQELQKDPKLLVQATLGLSLAHQSKGEYEQALSVIDKALQSKAKDPDLLARQGELLHLAGRWDDALKSANAALEVADSH